MAHSSKKGLVIEVLEDRGVLVSGLLETLKMFGLRFDSKGTKDEGDANIETLAVS